MPVRTPVPNLVLAQRVLDKMAAAASHFIEDETGEAMVGLVVPSGGSEGVPTIYVLDTISPDESAVRQMHTFQQGDERQDELIWWLQENWRAQRQKRQNSDGSAQPAKWNVPLRYLGDWHKQPGYMIAPSGGDLMTALDWLDDPENAMEALLVPIVTLGHPTTTEAGAHVNYITLPQGDGTYTRVDFWYIHQDGRAFQPMSPAVYPDDQLPDLSPYPWHLVNTDRAQTELNQLQGDGLFISIVLWEVDNKLPLEVCFLMARRGTNKVLIVATQWDYPQSKPRAYLAPFVNMGADDDIYDVFEDLWEQAEPVSDPPGWQWTADKYLVDYVHAIEDHLGLRITEPAQQPSTTDANAASEEES